MPPALSHCLVLFVAAAMSLPVGLRAAALDRYAASVSDFALDNGLRFVLAERTGAPVVSVVLHVRAGIGDDPPGRAGIARLFERLFFHGTQTIGSHDWGKEQAANKTAGEAAARLQAARRSDRTDLVELQKLELYARLALESALAASRPGHMGEVLGRNGIQFRAEVGPDAVVYSFQMPSTRVAVCFKLLSEWLRAAEFRYLREELDHYEEARKRLADGAPVDKLQTLLARAAFPGHRYGNGLEFAGPAGISRRDVDEFFRTWFTPPNIVVGVVGDVRETEVRRLARDYFASLTGAAPPERATAEPETLDGERRIRETSPRGGAVAFAYRRPPAGHPDSTALSVLHALLTGPGGGRLEERLGKDRRVVLASGGSSSYPGQRESNLFMLMAFPGAPLEQVVQSVDELLDEIRETPPSDEELTAVKAWMKMRLLGRLEAPATAAASLARAQAELGGWREMLAEYDRIENITAPQVTGVAARYLTPKSRLVVLLATSRGGQ